MAVWGHFSGDARKIGKQRGDRGIPSIHNNENMLSKHNNGCVEMFVYILILLFPL